ncbi:hypothetical protein PAESOLCIP111_05138 [Paenibacillus solanacearum]|uniref:Uncharacterized protein n=1 Tax=Paenibacillus solanacearum TaxID=2048548 RepID=A0A916K991_9BACL|nr:hypothetical protein [Paenibacillus solanacearum]CAG7646309.1 hypothetical protein PAESOLCIP111_05138 [Paenibacillus solanacearum]
MNHQNKSKAKWLRTMLAVLTLAVAVPVSTAFADGPAVESRAVDKTAGTAPNVTIIRANGVTTMGAGEWDYLGQRSTVSSQNPTNYVHSGGGDFKFQVVSGPSGGAWYQLREYDPGSNADEIVTGYEYFLYPGDTLIYRGISNYVDGDNKKAEFYVYERFSGSGSVKYWD